MISEPSSITRTSSAWPSSAIALSALLAVGSLLVYFYRFELPDTRRVVLALASLGFFFAPASTRPLRVALWLPAVAVVAWGGRMAGAGAGEVWLWVLCSVFGAALSVRAGGRAVAYYLPPAESERGLEAQRTLRVNLLSAVLLFIGVYLWDTFDRDVAWFRGGALLLAAVFFLRYLLLQSKFLGLPAVPFLRPPEARGIVPSQRWPLLIAMLVIGTTDLPAHLLGPDGTGRLLITSVLLLVLAGLVFVIALTRLERSGSWPRALVRRTSFFAGMTLAVSLAAALVELEAWGPVRFTSFGTFCTFALVVLPFAQSTTRLLHSCPRASILVPPAVLSVMNAPLTAVNGPRWSLTQSGFLFAFAVVMLVYQLVVVVRERGIGRVYLGASLLVMGVIFFANGTAWAETGGAWKIFLIAVGFVMYAVDLFDRVVRSGAGG